MRFVAVCVTTLATFVQIPAVEQHALLYCQHNSYFLRQRFLCRIEHLSILNKNQLLALQR